MRRSVHPRVCGEQWRISGNPLTTTGSSPRVAGNRRSTPGSLPTRAVHPRVCGEQNPENATNPLTSGSSPRVRGTAMSAIVILSLRRFIPACVGSSASSSIRPAIATVHPRVCGEQGQGLSQPSSKPGSSPRVRGTAIIKTQPYRGVRFIPACAGNREYRGIAHVSSTVHPRVCGEQRQSDLRRNTQPGSSPRVRGTASSGSPT